MAAKKKVELEHTFLKDGGEVEVVNMADVLAKGKKVPVAVVLDANNNEVNTYSSAEYEDFKERAERVAVKVKGRVEVR